MNHGSVSVYSFAVALAASAALFVTAPAAFAARVATESVNYFAGDRALRGYIAYDAERTEPLPIVLVVHDWWGHSRFARERARELAEEGFLAMAVDLFGPGVAPESVAAAQQWADPFLADRQLFVDTLAPALDVARSHERADPERAGVVGYGFGGRAAMELAMFGTELDAAVAIGNRPGSIDASRARNITGGVLMIVGSADPEVTRARVDAFRDAVDAADADATLVELTNVQGGFFDPLADTRRILGVRYDEQAADLARRFSREFLVSRLDPPASPDRADGE